MNDKAEYHVFAPDSDKMPKHLTRGLLRNQFALSEYGELYHDLEAFQQGEIDRQIDNTDIHKMEVITGLKAWGLKKKK
jgi:hypothetical protein